MIGSITTPVAAVSTEGGFVTVPASQRPAFVQASDTSRYNKTIIDNRGTDGRGYSFAVTEGNKLLLQMADETGLILPKFVRHGEADIHARTEETLPLWWELLKDEMPHYRMPKELFRHALGQPPGISQDLDE